MTVVLSLIRVEARNLKAAKGDQNSKVVVFFQHTWFVINCVFGILCL